MKPRIVEAYPAGSIINRRDGLLHLVARAECRETLCLCDVANLTMIPFRDFRHPAYDAKWCQDCAKKLQRIEEQAAGCGRPRGGQKVLTEEQELRIAELVASGISTRGACLQIGVAESTGKRALRRMRDAVV